MMQPSHFPDPWPAAKVWLWNTVFWVVLWSFSVYNNFQWAMSASAPFSWDMVFSWSLPYYLVMIFSGPLIHSLYHRWKLLSYLKQGLKHLIPALIVGFVHQFFLNVFYILFHPVSLADTTRDFQAKFIQRYEVGFAFSANGFLFYWLCLGLILGIDIFRRYQKQQLANAAIATELSKARFQTLQNQLQPHFLFNTFNSLAMMARQEKHREVVSMISLVSDMLRETLKLDETQQLPLHKEVALVSHYLKIEEIRFRDRLTVTTHIDDEVTNEMVPTLFLQPIVENAFRHGISKTEGKSELHLKAAREKNRMIITVSNTGPALPTGWDLEEALGIGLNNVLRRLELNYGDRFDLTVTNLPSGAGVLTKIDLPLD